jgi:hypothetical protein
MDTSRSPDKAQDRWREELLCELARRRIPRQWQARLLEELADHLTDLKEETMSTSSGPLTPPEARLGRPQEVAAAAAAEYRKLGFFARRPVLTYLLGPLVAVPAAVVGFLLVAMPLLELGLEGAWRLGGGEPPPVSDAAANAMVGAVVYAARFVPFALIAWLYCRLARRHGRGWRCVMSACAVVAVYAGLFDVTMQARTAQQSGTLMMGLALPPAELVHLAQAAAPLAVGAAFLWRMHAQARLAGRSGRLASG